jgi:hypothetical protein
MYIKKQGKSLFPNREKKRLNPEKGELNLNARKEWASRMKLKISTGYVVEKGLTAKGAKEAQRSQRRF